MESERRSEKGVGRTWGGCFLVLRGNERPGTSDNLLDRLKADIEYRE